MIVQGIHNDVPRLVLFKDGTWCRMIVRVYQGACMFGDPTAYVHRDGELVWLTPGESGEFIEV